MEEDTRHRALSRGLSILEAVGATDRGLTVTEIAQATLIDLSSTSRLVSTLVQLGFLARTDGRRIVLTGRVLGLAKGFHQQFSLGELSRPHLAELRDVVNETVILTVRQGAMSFCVDQLDPERPFRMVPHLGATAPLSASAAGRAILFALPVAEQESILDSVRDEPVEHPELRLDRESWRRELEMAGRRGYVWIRRSDDVERVAAVVRGHGGDPVAAVAIYGPKYRMKGRLAELGARVRATAAQITDDVAGAYPSRSVGR